MDEVLGGVIYSRDSSLDGLGEGKLKYPGITLFSADFKAVKGISSKGLQ